MNWTTLVTKRAEAAYAATDGLLKLCEDSALGWKPATGSNWMTQGQLLAHIEVACGFCMNGFLTGEWGIPADAKPDEMMPPAEKLPTAKSVAAARKSLAKDKKLALASIQKAGEKALGSKKVAAPWDPEKRLLGEHFLSMVHHLETHKAQLFYYLKLQGKAVHTGHMYGM